ERPLERRSVHHSKVDLEEVEGCARPIFPEARARERFGVSGVERLVGMPLIQKARDVRRVRDTLAVVVENRQRAGSGELGRLARSKPVVVDGLEYEPLLAQTAPRLVAERGHL